MSLRAWVVEQRAGGERVAVLAATEAHARARGGALLTKNPRGLLARPEDGPGPLHYRCGRAGVAVAWSGTFDRYLACVTLDGRRHFAEVAQAADDARPPAAEACFADAARAAVQALVDADDLDEGHLLWERSRGADRPRVERSRR